MFSSGILMVFAGPSGAGKTTISHHLVDSFDEASFSVSSTTRKPRGSEVDGKDYNFISRELFSRRVRQGFFLEWAEVHGNFYGTDGDWVRRTLASGRSVILDIDVQGAVQIKEAIPSAVLVFVLPSDRDLLLRRLRERNTENGRSVSERMEAASGEVAAMGSFDYFLLNHRLQDTLEAAVNIYRTERMKLRNMGWPVEAMEYHPGYYDGLSWWRGRKVVVSSGPTREMIDSVRFISNRSSGLMGLSLAEAFLEAGAEVTLISGPARWMDPPGPVRLVRVTSASGLMEALSDHLPGADLLVMAAAVSDFRPEGTFQGKLRRDAQGMDLHLVPVPDLLAELQPDCPVLAFALEFGEAADSSALKKMQRKGAAAVFLNRGDVEGAGMESVTNTGVLMFASCSDPVSIPPGSKKHTALGIAAAMGREFQGRINDETD